MSNKLVPLVFGEKWNSIIPVLQLLCVVGLLRSVGNPIGSLLMAKARVDISFKFNVFKTFLFIPAIVIGGQMGAQSASRLASCWGRLSTRFSAISGSLNRRWFQLSPVHLSSWLPFISRRRRWWSVMCWALC
ncbi:hypothetical protein ACNKHR_23865 [Shigella flexneri]